MFQQKPEGLKWAQLGGPVRKFQRLGAAPEASVESKEQLKWTCH